MHSWYVFIRIVFIQVSAVLTRCKYYFIWFLSEGACILSGFGFNGLDKDGNPRWDKLTNVYVLQCEFAQSLRQLSAHWNMATNHWLRHYVYLRVYPMGSTYATLMTYVISSLWHGFHPGYYCKFHSPSCFLNDWRYLLVFFLTAGGLQLIARQVRRVVRPLVVNSKIWKPVYDVCTWLASMGVLNMFVPCFDLLHVPLILQVWREIYYSQFIVVFAGVLLFFVMKPTLQKLKKE